jgi:hypothetical protein
MSSLANGPAFGTSSGWLLSTTSALLWLTLTAAQAAGMEMWLLLGLVLLVRRWCCGEGCQGAEGSKLQPGGTAAVQLEQHGVQLVLGNRLPVGCDVVWLRGLSRLVAESPPSCVLLSLLVKTGMSVPRKGQLVLLLLLVLVLETGRGGSTPAVSVA